MALDVERASRGALAGAIAAGVWAAQSPLDCRVFGVRYLDQELLGKMVTRGPAWHAVGLAMHAANGAALGAAYAVVAPRLPVAPWARGPLAGLAEHVASWPLTVLVDRLHPARDELPRLAGSTRAFAQATWRHLLFGAVLGELERRLDRSRTAAVPGHTLGMSCNGHGDTAHAAGTSRRPAAAGG
jgi:hypothetical protein